MEETITTIKVDAYTTLFLACIVLLLGRFLNKHIEFLRKYHIPTPVSGGITVSIFISIIYYVANVQYEFVGELATSFSLLFFASIGLSADFKRLIAGGRGLILLLIVSIGMVVVQNSVGVTLAKLFGLDYIYGLIAGSITLVGGHGTGGAWGKVFEDAPYFLSNASAVAFAAATWGLVTGGIFGGPVSRYLIKKHNLKPTVKDDDSEPYEDEERLRPIRASSVTEGFLCLATSMFCGDKLATLGKTISWMPNLPTFVYVLLSGIILRAILTNIFNRELKEVTIDVLGNVFLSLFLAISLLQIKIWTLTDLALPIITILAIQTVITLAYSIFVCFNFMGRDYDAAVICGGQIGFSLGATPTAIANMQSITEHFGPSHKAFLLIPLVGAFFIDICNAMIISAFL